MRTPTHLLKTLMLVATAFVLGAGFTIVNNSAGIFTTAAWADESHTDHCICGAAHKEIGDHKDSNKYTGSWTGVDDLSKIIEAGHYYLTGDVTISQAWSPANGVVLCLNGHKITADGDFNAIKVDSEFTITDCKNSGKISHTSEKTGCGVNNTSKVYMYGGSICDNREPTRDPHDATTYAGGVINSGYAVFKMYGGSISNNVGTDGAGGVLNKGQFYMYGGSISNNTAEKRDGGGVANRSQFFLRGGSIAGNTARKGGGIWNYSSLDISGGSITGNTAREAGGGVYNIKDDTNTGAIIVLEGGTPVIENNKSGVQNSNLYTDQVIKMKVPPVSGTKIGLTLKNFTSGSTVVKPTTSNTSSNQEVYDCELTEKHLNYFIPDNSEFTLLWSDKTKITVRMAHKHTLCNMTGDHTGTGHSDSCSGVTIYETPWTDNTKLPTEEGTYYLETDVTLAAPVEISKDVTLCLNGHTIKGTNGDQGPEAILVTSGTLKITNCQSTGQITSQGSKTQRGITIKSDAVLELYNVIVSGFQTDGDGAGIKTDGSVGIYAKSIIKNNTATNTNSKGGGIYVGTHGQATMNCILSSSESSISGNKAANGGGVYNLGTFSISQDNYGNISRNFSTAYGGGAGIYNNGVLKLDGNTWITNNTVREGNFDQGADDLVTGKCIQIADTWLKDKLTNLTTRLIPNTLTVGDTVFSGIDNGKLSEQNYKKISYIATEEEGLFFNNGAAVLYNKVDVPTVDKLTYDGTEQSFPIKASDNFTITGGTEKATNAGTYSVSMTPKANYAWSDGTVGAKSVNWTIDPKEPSAEDFTVNYPDADAWVYDKTSKTVTAALKSPYTDATFTIDYSWGTGENKTTTQNPVDAREYTVTLHVSAGGNFAAKDITLDKKLVITPRPATIKVNDAQKYEGSSDPTFSGTVTGLAEGDTAADLNIQYKRADADKDKQKAGDDIEITATGNNANYNVTVKPAKLTILPKEDQTLNFEKKSHTVTYEPDLTFTREVQGAKTDVTYTSSDKNIATVDQDGKVTVRKAGTVTITATAASSEKYNKGSASYTLTIKKAEPAYTVPSDLNGKQYEKLSTVVLPSGWAWDDPDQDMDQDGSHKFDATFTPADTENYNTAKVTLMVEVAHTHKFEMLKVDKAVKTPATCTDNTVYYYSCQCGELDTEETFEAADTALGHDFENGTWQNVENDTKHAKQCSRCDGLDTAEDHTEGTPATCTSKAVCETCDLSYGGFDADNHSDLKHITAAMPTKDSDGNIEYWYCEGCHKYFGDAAATREITKADTITSKLPAGQKSEDQKSARTGDDMDMIFWFALLLMSGCAVTGIATRSRMR